MKANELMTVKANELMIGDLVSHFSEGKKCVVTELRGRKVAVSFTGDDGKKKYSVLLPEMAFEPIPITAEILDKNFNSAQIPDDPYGACFFGGNDYIEVYIKEYTDGLWEVQVDEVEMGGLPSWRMYVSNVNELQHALRLCGIDKEIRC